MDTPNPGPSSHPLPLAWIARKRRLPTSRLSELARHGVLRARRNEQGRWLVDREDLPRAFMFADYVAAGYPITDEDRWTVRVDWFAKYFLHTTVHAVLEVVQARRLPHDQDPDGSYRFQRSDWHRWVDATKHLRRPTPSNWPPTPIANPPRFRRGAGIYDDRQPIEG